MSVSVHLPTPHGARGVAENATASWRVHQVRRASTVRRPAAPPRCYGLRSPEVGDDRQTIEWLSRYVDELMEAQTDPHRQQRLFDRSPVPMVMVDGDRRHVHANLPARFVLRHRLAALRRMRIDDLTPRSRHPRMEAAWKELRVTGRAAGDHDVAAPAGDSLQVVFDARRDAQPGLSLIAFVPAGWSARDLKADFADASLARAGLTARELEVLQLAAEGLTSQMIAERLVVSVTTVSTHLRNIYNKLDVRDRAAAVASGLRLGLIV